MEIINVLILFVIAIEGALLLYKKEEKREEEVSHTNRREVYGTFKDPYSYRKNTRNQYVPIKPGSKMLDGDDEE